MNKLFGALCALAIVVIAGAAHAQADDFGNTQVACALTDGGVTITQLDSCREIGGTPRSVCFRSGGRIRCGWIVEAPQASPPRPAPMYIAPVQPLLHGPCYEPGFSGRVGSVWLSYRSGYRYCSGGMFQTYSYTPFGSPGGSLFFYYRSRR